MRRKQQQDYLARLEQLRILLYETLERAENNHLDPQVQRISRVFDEVMNEYIRFRPRGAPVAENVPAGRRSTVQIFGPTN